MKKLLISTFVLALLLGSCTHNADTTNPIPKCDTSREVLTTSHDTAKLPDITETTDVPVFIDTDGFETTVFIPETTDAAETAAETEPTVPTPVPVPENGYVYLTFDDGPSKYTETVLDILDEYGVTATFFVVGESADHYPERVRAIVDAGHILGCHSATHDYRKIYASPEAIAADIAEWESIITDVIGEVPDEHLYRFPGGSNCTVIAEGTFDELYKAVTSLGYRGFDWTCGNNDMWYGLMKEGQSKEEYLRESLINSLRICGDTRILLVHETVAETVDMLPWIIEYLQGEGYAFEALDMYEGDFLFAG